MTKIIAVPAEVVWPIRHQVMYPDMKLEDIKLESDQEGLHLALIEDENVISVVSLFKNGEDLQFRKFATLEAYQGKGYGSSLLRHVIDYAQKEKCTRLWCNARKNASLFYQRFGFKETNTTFFKDGYDFVIMELLIDQGIMEQ
ncbi:GNAT family N-acetyltransferase [Desertivirga brevis]|uniref:GNAT family N-acetyltransferase n=1 Tax=Desertivirga brevis TaxID=2810310 RepID=UPI001A97CD70|nr:GNAT family N-acetyltransferase [Pedobacter sp. SYSU D00873]